VIGTAGATRLQAITISYPPDEVGRFFTELESFRKAFTEFFDAMSLWSVIEDRKFRLELTINNGGFKPADDVLLVLEIPRNVEVFAYEDEIREPEPPTPPSPPKGRLSNLIGDMADYALLARSPLVMPEIDRSPYGYWSLNEAEDCREGTYRVRRIMHGWQAPLEPLWIVFPRTWEGGPLVIPYTIHSENLPTAISGRVTILTEVASP
jgi:hypothetical protein